MQNFSTLVFDLDGTISDPSLGIFRCINHALHFHGFPQVSEEAVAAQIGPPLDETFSKFQPTADRSVIASLISKYRERYAEVGYSENKLYPGMAESLQMLSSGGIRIGICTSKRKDFAEKILSMFGLLPLFSFVNGGDVGIKKQEQLHGLLQSGEIDSSSVMIGDRSVDIYSAKSNGLQSIGVLWGFGDMDELQGAGANVILRTTDEVGELGI